MLTAQKYLEEVEESIAKYLPKETIEVAHVQFLSKLVKASDSDTPYLLAVGWLVIRPLSSHLQYTHIKAAQTQGMVGGRFPRIATFSGDYQG